MATTHAAESQHDIIDQNGDEEDENDNDSAKEAQRKYGVLIEHPLNDFDINQRPLKKRKLLLDEYDERTYSRNRAKKLDFEFVQHMLALHHTKDDKIDL